MKTITAAALAAPALAVMVWAAGAAVAQAADGEDFAPAKAGQWEVAVRLTDVATSADDPILTSANVATGLKVDVTDSIVPTFGFTYRFTDNLSVEAIAGASHHKIKAVGPGTDVLVHETWVLPPVVTLKYDFAPAGRIDPYVGAGVNYMLFFGGKDKNGFTVDPKNGFGYAVQAGVDIGLKGPYVLNLDVKKVWFQTDSRVNGGALKSSVNLDPWVISAGVARRF